MSAVLVNAVVVRLKSEVAALHGRVGKAAQLAPLIDKDILPLQMPAAFVLWAGDKAEPNSSMGVVRQRMTETISVIIVHRVAGDISGALAADDADPLVDAARDVLVGWCASGDFDPFEYQRGVTLAMRQGAVFLQIDVSTRWLLRRT